MAIFNNLKSALTASDVGAIPVIDARSENYDMDAILKSGRHYALYETGATTLGTPFEKGVTASAAALILSYNNSSEYGIQFAFMSGGLVYTRSMIRGIISDWSTGFLPLNGGVLNGELFLNGGYARLISGANQLQLECRDIIGDTSNRRLLMLNTSTFKKSIYEALMLTDIANGTSKSYKIFGEHNKPSGTYTGNGATSRTIAIGGSGKILVFSDIDTNLTPMFAIIDSLNLAMWSPDTDEGGGSYEFGADYDTKFNNGNLNIASDMSGWLNESGVSYYYFVI